LQDSELTVKVGSVSTAYPADSRKAFAKFAITQPQRNIVSLKGITDNRSTQIRLKNFLHDP